MRIQVEHLQGELDNQRDNQAAIEQRVQARIETLKRELAGTNGAISPIRSVAAGGLRRTQPDTTPRAPESPPASPAPVAGGGASLFGHPVPARRAVPVAVDPAVQVFLNHVVMGEQNEAEVLLQNNPALALAYGDDVEDLPNGMRDLEGKTLTRHFERITGFQYALWAGDWHMWRMIQKYLQEDGQRAQCLEILTGELPWIAVHGRYFDLQPLIDALRTYVNQYRHWNNGQRRTYWSKTIGGLQRQLPVHVINEYCRPDRSFDPVPDFRNATALPRRGYVEGRKEYGVDWWFNQVISSGALGSSWGAARGVGAQHGESGIGA